MSELYLWAIPVFVVTMILEWLILRTHREHTGYTGVDTAASLSMGVGYLVVGAIAKFGTLPLYQWAHEHAVVTLWGFAWSYPLLFVLDDLCMYVSHRCGHRVRLLWASHVNHHSSTHFNLSTALRQSWTAPLLNWPFWLPLALLGFPVEWIVIQQAVNLFYQYLVHTELIGRMGPLERILNTPSHHRVHHGANLRYLDRNYGGILILWDRMFGTFQAEDEKPVFGLTHNVGSYNPVRIAFHEFEAIVRDIRAAGSPKAALGYLVRPPGWRHDGPGETVEELLARQSGPTPR
jgi:sterol desaturase/sphingolipid hydroxylase (fatty acid hydroxylase superfamily)